MSNEQEKVAVLMLNINIKKINELRDKSSAIINQFSNLLDNLKYVKFALKHNSELVDTLAYIEKNALELGDMFKTVEDKIKNFKIQEVEVYETI